MVRWRLVTLRVTGPELTVVGVSFRFELQISWTAPESYVTLDSPGVVELDTSVVPDVLGLRARYQNAVC